MLKQNIILINAYLIMKGHDYIFGNNHTHYNLNITHNLTFCDHSLFKIEHISKQFS